MTPEQIAALTEVDSHSPANQEEVSGKLLTGEDVKGQRWFDPETKELMYKFAFNGKHYMGKKEGAENEWLFSLV